MFSNGLQKALGSFLYKDYSQGSWKKTLKTIDSIINVHSTYLYITRYIFHVL